jgi:hypothetical protein
MTAEPREPIRDFFTFLLGAVLLSAGVFLFFNQIMVGSRWGGQLWRAGRGVGFSLGEGGEFGLLLLPLTLGVVLLFSRRHQRWGWFLILASLAAISVGILQTLFLSFQPTTLWNLLTMLALIGSGGGLMFRSLQSYSEEKR